MLFLLLVGCVLCLPLDQARSEARDYFVITVVDSDTGRGVPLVELKTTHDLRFYTDSNGVVAINEPELVGQSVHFAVKSHGYEHAADGFGYRGVALPVTRGGRGQIKIKRLNIAERLYRITGAGIYRDSVLAGQKVPLKQPLLNAQVMGQDTVMATPYRGKIYWFWGDTNKPSYPLGNFATSGATSLLPGRGGLDAATGIDLTYWVDDKGFSKRMIPLTGFGGPIWVGGLFTLQDKQGQERLLTKFAHLKPDTSVGANGIAIFNDDKAIFEPVRTFDPSVPLYPEGYPFRAQVKGQPYLNFQSKSLEAFPLVRVRAAMDDVLDPQKYEAFTCLVAGSRFDKAATRLDRSGDGHLRYAWKANTPALGFEERKELIASGKMKEDESLAQLRDFDTDAAVRSHVGSVFWNPYRKRWIMITGQSFGASSFLGEVWFAEADTPAGPWVYARKILTHEKYTFYNPTQHPFFDQDGGRRIYFEGTYTDTYSGNPDRTPRYNYNQIMYGLSLDDARLTLPAPVYRVKRADGTTSYALRDTIAARNEWTQIEAAPFFAIPTHRPPRDLIAVYGVASAGGPILQTEAPKTAAAVQPLFYALAATPAAKEATSPAIMPLYEYRDRRSGARWYSVDAALQTANATRSALPLCRVWRNPSTVLALDYDAQPLP
ncbi:MAG: hypothetical protein JWN98_1348 [Abditibacteriota bacterium]|nr:hypothetical protein [Abditibacteriota bacterium]